jgi:hypothetical protein
VTTPLFRREAVAYHEAGLGPGNLLRQPARTEWIYRLLLGAMAATVAMAITVRVPRSITGPARLDANRTELIVYVPAAASGDVRAGLAVSAATTAGEVRGQVAGAAEAVDEAGRLGVRIHLDPAAAPNASLEGRAVIHLPSERLAVIIVPALRWSLGG